MAGRFKSSGEAMTTQEALITLGLSSNATKDEIKTAHRHLALKHHPDKGGVLEDFLKVQAAYETLTGKVIERRRPMPAQRSGWVCVIRVCYDCDWTSTTYTDSGGIYG
jgi:DnaJ family protein C protein 7